MTDVPGLRVGHAQVSGGGSGCTVVLGPFRARVMVPGLASGSRELETLRAEHITARTDAIVLSGGSAFGLATAHGVMGWLESRGEGHETAAGPVPIVPAAILFDLAEGRGRPGPVEGRAACEAAHSGPVSEGRVGAGTGATVGKMRGLEYSVPGGIGTASARFELDDAPADRRVEPVSHMVGALAVVNALGSVIGADGRVVAGPERIENPPASSSAPRIPSDLSDAGDPPAPAPGGAGSDGGIREGENTTLCVVATDAPLTHSDLGRILAMAATALPRRIDPVHTPFDGDVVFGLSTSDEAHPIPPRAILRLGMIMTRVLETAILRGVARAGDEGVS